mmetsp:Transcript_22840/g.64184  ORF Transcript_22840/g.64184 Transcript_22840/m.64184 type:complete len:282 (+) Transcript_22840:1160-2005(+)
MPGRQLLLHGAACLIQNGQLRFGSRQLVCKILLLSCKLLLGHALGGQRVTILGTLCQQHLKLDLFITQELLHLGQLRPQALDLHLQRLALSGCLLKLGSRNRNLLLQSIPLLASDADLNVGLGQLLLRGVAGVLSLQRLLLLRLDQLIRDLLQARAGLLQLRGEASDPLVASHDCDPSLLCDGCHVLLRLSLHLLLKLVRVGGYRLLAISGVLLGLLAHCNLELRSVLRLLRGQNLLRQRLLPFNISLGAYCFALQGHVLLRKLGCQARLCLAACSQGIHL